ncbi:helix-turn-helix transcriptional regulator [Sphingomonas sp. ID0503]|uniref:helix-turn-helix transcriptional regulator n=1 Tax=Sphingomonas sp. ID0503 TaxID=3399691 RepID=UPI003AFA7D83
MPSFPSKSPSTASRKKAGDPAIARQAEALCDALLERLQADETFIALVSAAVAAQRHASDVSALIALEEVERLTGIKKSKIYQLVREARFPAPYKPGGASTRWSRAEVVAWCAGQRTVDAQTSVRA